MGSVVSHEFGPRNNLPPYVCIPSMPTNFAGSGYLSSAYAPFSLGSDPASGNFSVQDLTLPGGVDDKRFTTRRSMLDAVNAHFAATEKADPIEAMDTFYQRAYNLVSSQKAREAFNIHAEPAKIRDEYGRHPAGQRMLLARRLVAAGVRLVSLTYGGWDHHVNIKNGHAAELPQFDQGFATLIRDLDRNGLLDSTLVMISSEFGRTPKINGTAGRDHWPKVFTVVLAGGGLKKGFVYGSSDATATEPENDPLTIEDLAMTVYHQLGIAGEKKLLAPGNRPHRYRAKGPCARTSSRKPDQVRRRRFRAALLPVRKRRRRRAFSDIRGIDHMQARRILLLALALLLSTDLAVRASSPTLGNILPRGVQRGKEEVLIFQGARLSDAKEVLFYYPGVTVKNLKVLKDDSVQVTVQVAADCRLGEHAVRLRTGTGVTELRTFFVGALPVVAEKEPNNEFTTPQKIPLNVTVTGVVDSEDVDYFAVEAKKGQRITAEIEGMRLANTLFDPCISILNNKRFELAVSDDTPLLGQDGVVSILAPEDGTYIIQVRESSYGGNGACFYRLHVGTFPRPLAVLPAGGKLGEKIEVRYLGDQAGEKRETVQLPAAPVERFGLFAKDDQGIAPSGLSFRLSEFGNVMEVEPNDEFAKATPVSSLPIALNGVIEKPGDVDHFRFKMKKGEVYDFHCYARRLGSPLDPVMLLMNSKGGGLVANDDSAGPDSYFRYQAPADDDYVLRIDDHLKKGGPTYVYRVEIVPVKPTMTLSVPKVALYSQDRQMVAVPRGNRFAVLVNVARADFGGELTMGADKLPKGMTASAENMMPYLDTIPMVFEATPDAPVAGNLVNLFAKHVDPKQLIPSKFSQMLELVYGPPGQSVYWTETVNQLACAVTDEAPFKIHIVEPKVPLVHNGSINLKIVAERKKGYNDAITIIALWNPPGVGSVGSAVIPAGQTETLYSMNSNRRAGPQVEICRNGDGQCRQRPHLGRLAAGHHRNCAAVRRPADGARFGRAGKEHRPLLQGAGADALRWLGQDGTDRPAPQGHSSARAAHQGQQGSLVQAQSRQGQPAGRAQKLVRSARHQ